MKYLIVMLLLMSTNNLFAGGGCFTNNCVVQNKVVNEVVQVANYAHATVTFVPSQVLLNSQVTVYDPNSSSIGYSYQGSATTAQSQVMTQPDDRLASLEKKVDALLSAMGNNAALKTDVAEDGAWAEVLRTNCVNCHGSKPDNGLAMLNPDGSFKDKLPRYDIYERMTLPESDPNHMPKKGGMVSDSSQEIIRKWINDGLKSLEY